jgi:hypothetical protein
MIAPGQCLRGGCQWLRPAPQLPLCAAVAIPGQARHKPLRLRGAGAGSCRRRALSAAARTSGPRGRATPRGRRRRLRTALAIAAHRERATGGCREVPGPAACRRRRDGMHRYVESATQAAGQHVVAPDAGEAAAGAGRQLASAPQPQAVDRRPAFVFAPLIGRVLVQDHLRLVEQLAQPARLGGFRQLPADAAAGNGGQGQNVETAEVGASSQLQIPAIGGGGVESADIGEVTVELADDGCASASSMPRLPPSARIRRSWCRRRCTGSAHSQQASAVVGPQLSPSTRKAP